MNLPLPAPTTLTRAVRVYVTPPRGAADESQGSYNTYAGFPSSDALGAWYEFEVSVRGVPERGTGYLATLAELDRSVRLGALHLLQDALFSANDGHAASPAELMVAIASAVERLLTPRLESLSWNLSPFHSYKWDRAMPTMHTLTAVFEFAASHRLNDPSRTPAENQAFFGKCNKLNGHGHNYHLEVSVAVAHGVHFGMRMLEQIVDEVVIERFDHMNLNIDCPEFHSMNPSVEHIAAVCFHLLKGSFGMRGVELRKVRLWETSKTSATVENESPTIMG